MCIMCGVYHQPLLLSKLDLEHSYKVYLESGKRWFLSLLDTGVIDDFDPGFSCTPEVKLMLQIGIVCDIVMMLNDIAKDFILDEYEIFSTQIIASLSVVNKSFTAENCNHIVWHRTTTQATWESPHSWFGILWWSYTC